MDSFRYPIGQFIAVEAPTLEQRSAWIEEIAELPKVLRETLQGLSAEQLSTPYRPGGWTVQQVVHHLADNDMNAYLRFKKALTEENPTAGSYREDLWAELSDYREVPIETSLVLIEALRDRFVALLRSLPLSGFQRTFTSPTRGAMSLDVATQRFAWHGRHHTAQIAALKERMGW
ncbi:putative metal-dependent hydrolase [Paenibacillus sp. M1]|uniref:Metal-dependent hydrolase n=1 Tax=Paenibacillus haidiansis TaxID=1574488 RepID=A0ABU7VX01_9BACL